VPQFAAAQAARGEDEQRERGQEEGGLLRQRGEDGQRDGGGEPRAARAAAREREQRSQPEHAREQVGAAGDPRHRLAVAWVEREREPGRDRAGAGQQRGREQEDLGREQREQREVGGVEAGRVVVPEDLLEARVPGHPQRPVEVARAAVLAEVVAVERPQRRLDRVGGPQQDEVVGVEAARDRRQPRGRGGRRDRRGERRRACPRAQPAAASATVTIAEKSSPPRPSPSAAV
jgi:hypothetical protein